jgi:twitching motility two-component system response regulator PilH
MYYTLVVDDSPVNRLLLVQILEKLGLPTLEARDGIEVFELLQEGYLLPVLVLLDVDMPRMNGYEVCRKLKSDPKTQAIPIVMCTGQEREKDPYWGTERGANAYIQKPFKINELSATIEQLLPAYTMRSRQLKAPAAS